jgi:hypothetical protein
VIFGARHKRNLKNMPKKVLYQAGMTWQFGRISGDYIGGIHSAYDV